MRPNVLLIHGDARHLPLRDESVQCVVTTRNKLGQFKPGTSAPAFRFDKNNVLLLCRLCHEGRHRRR